MGVVGVCAIDDLKRLDRFPRENAAQSGKGLYRISVEAPVGRGVVGSYLRSVRTFCWAWLAWAIIAVDAWARIWALAIAVVSAE